MRLPNPLLKLFSQEFVKPDPKAGILSESLSQEVTRLLERIWGSNYGGIMTKLAEMVAGESYEEFIRYEGFVAGLSHENGLVFILTAMFADEEQRKSLSEGAIELRILRRDSLLLFLAKIGDLNWMDAPFALSQELKASGQFALPYHAPKGGIPYTFLMADGATGELVARRQGKLSAAAQTKLLTQLEALQTEPLPSAADLDAAYSKLVHTSSSEDLAKEAGRGYKLRS